MKFPMNLAMACAAVLLMGGVSAHAATNSSSTSSAEAVCSTLDGAQDPVCKNSSQSDEANLTRWGRGGHRGGGWGRGPIVRRGWCYWHPRAPRCRF